MTATARDGVNDRVSVVKDPDAPEGFSLKRWSRRKLDAARAAPPPAAPADAVGRAPDPAAAPAAAPAATPTPMAPMAPSAPEATLPPLDTLNFDSDLTAFFQPKVDEDMKRAALKKLLSDPRFNVMDGLDIYIDDYTKPDPMPAGMLDRLAGIYRSVTEAAVADPVESAAGPAAPVPDVAEGQAAAPVQVAEGAAGDDAVAAPPVQGPPGEQDEAVDAVRPPSRTERQA